MNKTRQSPIKTFIVLNYTTQIDQEFKIVEFTENSVNLIFIQFILT